MVGLFLVGAGVTSCSLMDDDWGDCPDGLYLSFKYDYNLDGAELFNEHVGAVTVYVFDEDNRLVMQREEANAPGAEILKASSYTMHLNLEPGIYKLVVLAGQRPYQEMLAGGQAKFVRSELKIGDPMEALDVQLDRVATEDGWEVPNAGLPLDTLWHGIDLRGIRVSDTHAVYDTISLVRDTKYINVSLHQLDDTASPLDVNDYDMKILDRNTHLLWNNGWDEQETVAYTPYQSWNTDDKSSSDTRGTAETTGVGKTAHADFMTSRICYHEQSQDDAMFVIKDKKTGNELLHINLADMLVRTRTSGQARQYAPQEFLDRGNDYHLAFFLNGSKWEYVDVSVGALNWSVKIQQVDL